MAEDQVLECGAGYYSQVVDEARKLEVGLGLAHGFLESLAEEDDWSFVIKLHALIEAAMTSALTKYVGLSKVEDIFSRLELSDSKKGKIAFARALGIIDEDEYRFIQCLSEVRNKLVHDVKYARVDLGEYFSSLDRNKRKHYAKNLCYVDFGQDGLTIPEHLAEGVLVGQPKRAIWSTGVFLVAVLHIQSEAAQMEQETSALKIRASELSDFLSMKKIST